MNCRTIPEDPSTDEEKDNGRALREGARFSAVNPVLREGNSDRRAPHCRSRTTQRKFPHSMGEWSKASQSHADYMRGGDFFSAEQSVTMDAPTDVRIEFVGKGGSVEVKKELSLEAGEVIDSMRMSVNALRAFFEADDRRCEGDRRHVVAARQGDDDEDLAPDCVRPCGEGLL